MEHSKPCPGEKNYGLSPPGPSRENLGSITDMTRLPGAIRRDQTSTLPLRSTKTQHTTAMNGHQFRSARILLSFKRRRVKIHRKILT